VLAAFSLRGQPLKKSFQTRSQIRQRSFCKRNGEIAMRRLILSATLVLVTIVSPTTLLAETTIKVEGVKSSGAGSWNPPNPKDLCDGAKKNAMEKAASSGYKGKVVWDHLSSDSDCKLSTTRAGSIGVFYIMTAKGTFSQTGVQESLDPQGEFKAKFKEGCKSSNGSWIENNDGSFQCNARSGETNKCFKDTPPHACIHIK
jgi:hypothetical protein